MHTLKKLCAQSESRNNRENSGEIKKAWYDLNADLNQRTRYTQLKQVD